MKQWIVAAVLPIALSCFLSGCLTTAMTGANMAYNRQNLEKKADDYSIDLHAEYALRKDPELYYETNIAVSSFQNIVLLTGQAPTEALRQRAVNIVKSISGVIHIYDFIAVGPKVSLATDMQDSLITAKVKGGLIASNDVEPGKVKVVTEDGVVYLMGIITKQEADTAVAIAQGTAGVSKVVKIFYYITMPVLS